MKKHFSEQGFSLVETFVAITILLIMIVGPMTISSTTAKSTSYASEQVVAFFLAQEGLELAQKARDDEILQDIAGGSTLLTHGAWTSFTDDSGGPFQNCYSASGCGLEIVKNAVGEVDVVDDCNPISDCRLYDTEDPQDRARYTHAENDGAGNDYASTPFTRSVRFVYNSSDPQLVRVVSTVTWRTGSLAAEQKVELETYLFNVYD